MSYKKELKDKPVRILKFIEYYDDSFHDKKKTIHVSHDIICVFVEYDTSNSTSSLYSMFNNNFSTLFSNCQNAIMLGNDKVVNDAMKSLPRHIKNSFENKYLVLHFSYSYCDEYLFNRDIKVTYSRYKFTKTPYKIFTPKEVIITDLVKLDDMILYTNVSIKECEKYSFDCNCVIKFPFLENLEKDDNPHDEQFLEWHWK